MTLRPKRPIMIRMKLGIRAPKHKDWREAERLFREHRDPGQRPSLPRVSCLEEDDQGNRLPSMELRSYVLKTLMV